MTKMTDDCPQCGSATDRAFVRYHGNPNDAQMRTEWFTGLPLTIYGIVCMECGFPIAFLDPREDGVPDYSELPKGTRASEAYRVEEELT